MTTRIVINGFGRIGRQLVKAIYDRYWDEIEIAAIGITDTHLTEVRALLLKHDSVYGRFDADVEAVVKGRTNAIRVDDRLIDIVGRNQYGPVPEWRRWGVETIVEATGFYKDYESASNHLRAGADRVLITAPAKGVHRTMVLGVNEADFDPAHDTVVSNASCTTNCLAPAAKVLHDTYGIREGLLSTIHAYTSSQVLLDHATKEARRSRAAGLNIVPTTTGAAKAVGEVIPALRGRFHGDALRVPTPTVSLSDFTALVERPPDSAAEVNEALRAAAAGPLQNVLSVVDVPLVSVDFCGDPHSSIVDSRATLVQGELIKLMLWYDNEFAYACRVADMTYYISQRCRGRPHDEVRAEINRRAPQADPIALVGVPA